MVILDTTGSMSDPCGDVVQNEDGSTAMTASQSKKIDCAKDGVRRLLKRAVALRGERARQLRQLTPLDEVGLMVFPALKNPNGFDHDTNANPHQSRARPERERDAVRGQPDRQAELVHADSATFPRWFLTTSDVGYPTDEVQTITLRAYGGTFTLSYGAQTTNPPADPVQRHGSDHSGRAQRPDDDQSVGGNVLVTGNAGGPFTVMFMGGLSDIDVRAAGLGWNCT